MKSLSFLVILVAQFAAAQPTPVYFMGPGNVETDTALWRKHKLRSATVIQLYNDSMVIAYFEADSQNHLVVEFNKSTLTNSTYIGNRLTTQAIHKNVYFGYFNLPHEIDSIFYTYSNDSTVVVTKKQYELGSTRNHRNCDINEKWYLTRWADVELGAFGTVTYSYAFFTHIPGYIYATYPNGAYRIPRYEDLYVLEEKFKTNYTDTALYCVKQSEEVRVNDSVISLTENMEPDLAFTPPAQFNMFSYNNSYMNYHPLDNQFYTTTESKYDDNGLLTAIESKTYRTNGEFQPASTLISSQTIYRLTYTFFRN